jgi:hypothetical protein
MTGLLSVLPLIWGSIKFAAIFSLVGIISLIILDSRKLDSTIDLVLHWFSTGLTLVIASQLVLLWLGILSYWSLFAVLTLTFTLLIIRRKTIPSPARSTNLGRYLNPIVVIAGVNFLAIIVILGTSKLLSPPSSGDALAYHLPMAAQWLQQPSIFAHDVRAWFYPGNAELILTFLMLPYHADLFAPIADSIYLIVIALVTVRLVSFFGLKIRTALLTGVLLTTSPLFVRTIGEFGNDLFLVMIFLLGLYFSLRVIDATEKTIPILLAASCIGIVIGTKYVGIPYAALLFLFILMTWNSLLRDQAFRLAPLAAVLILVLGGSYFLRNLILTGNPLYPLAFGLGQLSFPEGDMSHLVATSTGISRAELINSSLLSKWQSSDAILNLLIGSLRLVWPILMATAALLVLIIRRGKSLREFSSREIGLILVCLGTFAVFLATPLSAENIPGTLNQIRSSASLRFGMISMAFLLILGASLSPQTIALDRWLAIIALASGYSVLIGIGLLPFVVVIVVEIALLLVITGPYKGSFLSKMDALRFSQYRHLTIVAASAGLFSLLVISLTFAIAGPRQAQREAAYSQDGSTEVIGWFDRQQGEPVIAVSIGIRQYPFHGPYLGNRVVALGLSQAPAEWVRLIEDLEPDYIVVSRENGDSLSPTFESFPVQEEILRENPGVYRKIFDDDFVHVYGANWDH